MKIAVPTENGKLCAHFGHCEKFAVIETSDSQIMSEEFFKPPAHEPGSYPKFLSDLGVNVIIAGGIGMKAQELFKQNNIEVCIGVNSDIPAVLVEQYLENELKTGENLCDH